MESGIDLNPFCSKDFYSPLVLGMKCVGCKFYEKAYNISSTLPLEEQQMFCNPNITEFPLPLYKCDICNRTLLDAVFAYIVIICCSTILANTWSVFVWLNVTKKRPQIYFKLSLTVSDFLFGVLVLPETLAHLISVMYEGNEEYYTFYKSSHKNIKGYQKGWGKLFAPSHLTVSAAILYISQGASLCSLLLLNVDRYIAIAYSLRYHRVMTKAKSLICIGGMWLAVATLGIATTLTLGSFRVTPSSMFLPVIEQPDENKHTSLYIVLVYLLPLSVVFLANVVVSFATSCKLTKLKGIRNFAQSQYKSSSPSSRKRTFSSFLTTSFHTDNSSKQLVRSSSQVPSISKRSNSEENLPTNKNFELIALKLLPRKSFSGTSSSFVDTKPPDITSRNFSVGETWREVFNSTPSERNRRKVSGAFIKILKAIPSRKKYLDKKANRSTTRTIRRRKNEHKTANRTLILILAIYSICVLPLTTLLVLYLLGGENKHSNQKSLSIGFTFTVGLFMTSSLWNCVIYNVRNREFRKSGKNLFKKFMSYVRKTKI